MVHSCILEYKPLFGGAYQDELGSNEDFMVAYIALELMGSSTSAAKKEMVPTVPRMTGIQGVETQLNGRVECYNMHRMSCRYAVHICCHGLGWICSWHSEFFDSLVTYKDKFPHPPKARTTSLISGILIYKGQRYVSCAQMATWPTIQWDRGRCSTMLMHPSGLSGHLEFSRWSGAFSCSYLAIQLRSNQWLSLLAWLSIISLETMP
jgi:hypothetical protein